MSSAYFHHAATLHVHGALCLAQSISANLLMLLCMSCFNTVTGY